MDRVNLIEQQAGIMFNASEIWLHSNREQFIAIHRDQHDNGTMTYGHVNNYNVQVNRVEQMPLTHQQHNWLCRELDSHDYRCVSARVTDN